MAVIGPNIAVSAAAGLLGVRLDPHLGCAFAVEIEGVIAGSFSECSGLQVETEFYDYREGGVNEFVHRFAGPTKYPPLVLKHGMTPIDGLWAWHQDVAQRKIERRNGTVYLLNRARLPVIWWDFKEAIPVKWTGPDLRAESATVAFESVELAHRGLSRPFAASVLAGAAGSLLTGGL